MKQHSLRRQVRELVALTEGLTATLAKAAQEICEKDELLLSSRKATTEALAKAAEADEEGRGWYRRWKELDDKVKLHPRELTEQQSMIDKLRYESSDLKRAINDIRRERDISQALAESIRDQAFPTPVFPWERGQRLVASEHRVGDIMHREEYR